MQVALLALDLEYPKSFKNICRGFQFIEILRIPLFKKPTKRSVFRSVDFLFRMLDSVIGSTKKKAEAEAGSDNKGEKEKK